MNASPKPLSLLVACSIIAVSPCAGSIVPFNPPIVLYGVQYDPLFDVATVVGKHDTNVSNERVIAMRWTISAAGSVQPTELAPTISGLDAETRAISDNGQWVCGFGGTSTLSNVEQGLVWRDFAPNFPFNVGFVPDHGSTSQLFDVANDGTAVGRIGGAVGDAIIYHPNGDVDVLSAQFVRGEATGISRDATRVVGWIDEGITVGYSAVVWQGGVMTRLENPDDIYANADCVSPDGRFIGGEISTTIGGRLNGYACAWINGEVHILTLEPDKGLIGWMSAIADDGLSVGKALVVHGQFDSEFVGFVWHPSWPHAMRFADFYMMQTGQPAPPDITGVHDVVFDGEDYHFIFEGSLGFDGWSYARTPAIDYDCPADWNGDFTVDVFDLLEYLNDWFGGAPAAELSGDVPAQIDVLDLLAYLDSWFAGTAGCAP